jgi:hypothetical protein
MESLGSPRKTMSSQTDCGWSGLQSSSTISEQQSSTNPRTAESFLQWREEPRKRLRSDETIEHSILSGCCVAR